MLPFALALLLAADPVPEEPAAPPAVDGAEEPAEEPPRLELTLWGGQAMADRGSGVRGEVYGAEATWRFDRLDLGLVGSAYERREPAADGTVDVRLTPVYLARIGQRVETRNGLLASFTLGVGAARTTAWRSWFQVALGVRATFGPAFVAGELAFESEDLLRLALGLGVSVF